METITKDQTNKTKANYKDNLNENFINFKNHMIDEFEAMKSSFFVEVKQIRYQLSNKGDDISTSSTLERLIVQL